ncbi:MAG: SHD1 domain-containing protein [Rubripirellula sp.]
MLFNRLFTASAVFLFAITQAWSPKAAAETWTSLQGTHSVEARMIGLWDGKVLLQLANGRRVSVPLMSLRSESRIQAEELSRKLKTSRAERIRELQGRAVAEASPAPDPLPQVPAAGNYVPPTPGANAAQFLEQFDDAVAAGHIQAIYDALPPNYRADIDSLVKLAAQRIKPTTWQAITGTAHQVGDLMVTRQNWFLSSPRMKSLDADQVEKVRGQVLALANVLRVGLSPEATQLDQMQAVPFSEWLKERDKEVAPYIAQLFKYDDSLARAITVESEKNGIAQVSLTQDSQTSKVTYVSVDGYWVPKTLADQWPNLVEDWKNELSNGAASMDTYAALIQAVAGPALQSLANAQNSGDFHAAMEPVFPIAETMISSVAAMMGQSSGLASSQGRGGNSGYQNGYEDEMGMDADYEAEMGMEEGYGDDMGGSRGGPGPGGFGPGGFNAGGSGSGGGSSGPRGGGPGGPGGFGPGGFGAGGSGSGGGSSGPRGGDASGPGGFGPGGFSAGGGEPRQ